MRGFFEAMSDRVFVIIAGKEIFQGVLADAVMLSDRVDRLDGGRIGFSGTVKDIHANDALRRAYFGRQ
jgi:hypothetical protein